MPEFTVLLTGGPVDVQIKDFDKWRPWEAKEQGRWCHLLNAKGNAAVSFDPHAIIGTIKPGTVRG